MPLTRIALSQQDFDSKGALISAILQQCLEQHFAVPAQDCFQLFDVYPESQRLADAHYPALPEPRSKHWLLFQISAGRPRNHAQKQAFYRALSEQLQQQAGVRAADVMVIIQFNQTEDWSFANGESFASALEENRS